MNLSPTTFGRLWSKVATDESEDGCWPFTGSCNENGYGLLIIGSRTDGSRRVIRAHQAAFVYANGYLPVEVRHSCDNPPCCRPSHLLAGTHADNMADAARRGRMTRKISLAQVAEIRALWPSVSQSELGRRYGVTQSAISYIVNHRYHKEAKP